MAVDVKLKASNRKVQGKANNALRSNGFVPGVVYGQGKEAESIQVQAQDLAKAFDKAGTSKLVELDIEGAKPKTVLFHDVQYDHLGKDILHFDLYSVKMDEKIRTEVPIHFTGESTAVYEQGAVLLKNLESVEVEALPGDLPENIEVNISGLTEMEQSILVSDLKVPEGVEILAEPEEMVVKTEEPREEEEEEEIPEDAEADVAAEHGAEAEETADEGGPPADGKTDDVKPEKSEADQPEQAEQKEKAK